MERGDADIVRDVLAGNTNAYAEIVRRYQSGLHRLCSARLGNRAQAEEAVQDVFLKAYGALASYRQASFKAWLYRIAVNHCNDLGRREKWKAWMFWKPADGPPPEPMARRAEAGDAASESLKAALSALPAGYRDALVLREMQGLSYDELGQALGCSLDAVKARLQRARKALADQLAPRREES